jgi:hypothetical protein
MPPGVSGAHGTTVVNQWRFEVLEGLSSNLFVRGDPNGTRWRSVWIRAAPGARMRRNVWSRLDPRPIVLTMLLRDCGKKPLLRRLPRLIYPISNIL